VALPRNELGETSESLELIKCSDFVGPPGSGAPLAQPFSVAVSEEVRARPQLTLFVEITLKMVRCKPICSCRSQPEIVLVGLSDKQKCGGGQP
jgi:hypothetical protein